MTSRDLRVLAILFSASACAHVPTEDELQPLSPLFEKLAKNPAGLQAQLAGHDLAFRGLVLTTGIATSTEEKLVTEIHRGNVFTGSVAITKRSVAKTDIPYVIVQPQGQPEIGAVTCYIGSGDVQELVEADAGKTIVASGTFWQIDTTGVLPVIALSDCRVYSVR